MWGIENEWFALFILIVISAGGIVHQISKVNETLVWGFNETWGKFNLIDKLYPDATERTDDGYTWAMVESKRDEHPPSMFSIEDQLSDIADIAGGHDESVLWESLDGIQNTLDEIRDALVKEGR